jgi:hypothetical protein
MWGLQFSPGSIWRIAGGVAANDPLAPSAPTVDLIAASDSGSSSTDNITNDTTPAFDIATDDVWTENDGIRLVINGVPQTEHVVTAGEAGGDPIGLGLGALSDGSYTIGAQRRRPSVSTTWSATGATISVTIDATAPTLSSPSGTQTGETTADLSVSTDEGAGTLYWVVDTSSTPPSAAQVKAGQDNGGAAANDSGSQAVSATGAQTISGGATGLTASTTYYAYFMHEDVAGNQSTVSASASFATTGGAAADSWGLEDDSGQWVLEDDTGNWILESA